MKNNNKKMIKLSAQLCILASFLVLTGCNNSTADLDDYFAEQRSKTPDPIAPIPEVKPYLRYVYPEHEKDPFDKSMLALDTGPRDIIDNGISIDTTRVPEFLEGFPLDSLKMVGTVTKDNTLWALIKIPDGAVQSVKPGNFIGQNYGKIISISDAEMSIKETVSNGLGGYKEKETSIVLNQE